VSSLLTVNGIEVIYNHVILVLKGVLADRARGRHRRAARCQRRGKTTTLRAVSNLLHGERGRGDKGHIDTRATGSSG